MNNEPIEDLSHRMWAAAQLAPGEGIEDGAARVAAILRDFERQTIERCAAVCDERVKLWKRDVPRREEAESCSALILSLLSPHAEAQRGNEVD